VKSGGVGVPVFGVEAGLPLSLFLRAFGFQPPGVGSILPNSASGLLLRTISMPKILAAGAQKFIIGLGCQVPASILQKLGCFWVLRL
jgi:hypothetical protein